MVPNKQIGWSQESILLHAVSKQLERLAGIIATSGGGGGGGGCCTTQTITPGDTTNSPSSAAVYAEFATVNTELDLKTEWKGTWVQQTYINKQQVLDQGYLAIANKTTAERPAPQKVGDPFNVYAGTIGSSTAVARQVLFGTKYTFTKNVFFEGWRVNLVAGNKYVIYLVRDPDGANVISQILQFIAQSTGWINLTAQNLLIQAGNVYAAIAIVSEPAAIPVTFTGAWNYQQPQNITIPLNGQITQPKATPSLMYISNIDNAAADRSAQLATLNIGDLIKVGTNIWAVQSKSPQVGYFIFGISPALLNPTLGVQTFTFETKTTATLTYPVDPNPTYWLTNPSSIGTVKGLFGADTPYPSIVPTDAAYGVDIIVQNLVTSADWDIQAFSGIGGGGSGGTTPTTSIQSTIVPGTPYTLSNADNGKQIITTSASAVVVNVPTGLTAGFNAEVLQQGTGQVTFTGVGVTLQKSTYELATTEERYALVAIDQIPNVVNEYHIYGQLTSI